MKNAYSQTWYELFLETQLYTRQEAAFLMRHLPNPPYGRILDVGCGPGRHARLLAGQGYEIVGIDLDEASLARARENTIGRATYLCHDMRRLEEVPGEFDAVISMWQSFGYFDGRTNRDVLRQISRKLAPEGRFILDIYHRHYFETHQGRRRLERRGVAITVSNIVHGNRLAALLEYENGQRDFFEWQLYTPAEIVQTAVEFDLRCLLMCTECDERKPVTAEKPRMNLVFVRGG